MEREAIVTKLDDSELPDAIKPHFDKRLKDCQQHLCPADGQIREGLICEGGCVKDCYVITSWEHWEYSGLIVVCKTLARALEVLAGLKLPVGTHCRCPAPAGKAGHEDCSLSCGYDIVAVPIDVPSKAPF